MKVIEIQKLNIPKGYKVIKNEFTNYDPEVDYTPDRNLEYLKEDILQIRLESSSLIIDLGWYGDVINNKGEFKILVIKNQNWSQPIHIIQSTSQKVIHQNLEQILVELSIN